MADLSLRRGLPALLVALAAVTPALGQSSFLFSYTLADGNVHALASGDTITFPAVDINATTSATVTITNSGTGAGTISGISITGTGFRLSSPNTPASVPAGQTLQFALIFAPSQPGSYSGTFAISVPGASITGALAGSTPPPNFSLEYIDPTTSNTLPLPSGSTLQFPNTQVGATFTIAMLVANTGKGTGSVTAVGLSAGTVFQVVSLAPLPVQVGPSLQLPFGIRFSPLQQQASADTLSVTANGQTFTVNLQAQAVQPIYSYQFSSSAGTTTVTAGGTAAIPNTTVGQTTNVAVTVMNTGLGAGQISALSVIGQGLSLSNPPSLPYTMQPGASVQFTLIFAPTQPGAVTGHLTFGTDTVTITATAIGAQLTYSYTSGSSAVPVLAGGAVLFTPLAVGSTESLTFSIQNSGTSSATISSIDLSAPSTIFALSGLPSLPTSLNPGSTITFAIGFAPNNTGNLTATLLVNSATFSLSGNGTQPPSLPVYSFTGPSGTAQPDQQPAIGLTLASPYPLLLQGTLTLTFNTNVFADDTTIQFANGGRTINFIIPANTTQALFSGNATSVSLQTGTTSGSIAITPSFALTDGFNLTPASPTVSTLTIPGLPPVLLNATVSQGTNAFTLTLSGFTTTRVLKNLNVQFTAVQGRTFNPAQLTLDVSSASAAWFQGTAASGFGGSFLLEVTFTLSNGNSTANLLQYLQSLSITATNDVGTSSAAVVPIQ
jgi:hypothetical protein